MYSSLAEHQSNPVRAGSDAIRRHDLNAWAAWLTLVLAGLANQLRRFAKGLQRDHDAIRDTLTRP